MQPGILSAGIENGGLWRWPSRSFWPFWLRMLGNLACPCNNPSQIWARITKFAQNMHTGILLAVIENGGHWAWPSKSFWPFWLRILGNLACLRDNLWWIWARINKFAPNMHLGILLAIIENWGHWPWPWPWPKVIWPSFRFKKLHSTLLLYTDLGRPRGATLPKRALVSNLVCRCSQVVPWLIYCLF